MNPIDQLKKNLPALEEALLYEFQNKNLLILALTHRSFVNEHREIASEHNERLEFLGDSVLNLALTDYLYHRLPAHPEGLLSQLRSKLVDAASCAEYLLKLNLKDAILLGRGERMNEGKAKGSILADVFEALIGALYLDGGLPIAKSFLLAHFEAQIEKIIDSPPRNFKAELQDYAQRKFQKTPSYKVVLEAGPDHAKVFHVMVLVNETEAGIGIGVSKKEAEQRAAFEALRSLE